MSIKGFKRKFLTALFFFSCIWVLWQTAGPAMAMHISEGILPAKWSAFWLVVALAFLFPGVLAIYRSIKEDRAMAPRLALAGALVFVISLIPIPVPISGTCSHPCGTPLAALMIGPLMSTVMASIALLLQALLLAHGGLTTWGANLFSMGVVGSLVGLSVYRLSRRWGAGYFLSGFLAGFTGDILVYFTTALQLASGVPSGRGFSSDLAKIFIAFLPTQLPLAVLEGMFTGGVVAALARSRPEVLFQLKGSGRNWLPNVLAKRR